MRTLALPRSWVLLLLAFAAGMAAVVEEIVNRPAPELGDAAAFTPATEIAAMRHEVAEHRLFAN